MNLPKTYSGVHTLRNIGVEVTSANSVNSDQLQ